MAADETPAPDAPPAPDGAALLDREREMRRALLSRPRFSIRTRVAAGFLLLFFLLSGITFTAIYLLLRFETKIEFLERLDSYAFEIQQARRYEKNYFLYGTNLADALSNIEMARGHLLRDSEEIETVLPPEKRERMERSLGRYERLIEELSREDAPPERSPGRRRIEAELRSIGAEILDDAQAMIARERLAIRDILRTSLIGSVVFLGFMLLLMSGIAAVIIRAVLGPVGRFRRHARRIGGGDFALIAPSRRFCDEFSDLAIAINRMVAEIAARQERLMHSGKMVAVGNLTSGIAHELNNPLNNIGLTAEALIDGFDEYGEREKLRMLEQINTQVERASGTIRNLLDFTREQRPAFTRVFVHRTVESTLRLVGNELRLAGVDLERDLREDLPPVRANPRSLEQVLLNLFLNAIQAMPGGGKLRVATRLDEERNVRIDVRDTGVGIRAEDLEHLFEPFFTTKEPGRGTGLGLSVSDRIIRKHNGRIEVDSRPGEGATFSVCLPAER